MSEATTVAAFDFGRAFSQVFNLIWRNFWGYVLLMLVLGGVMMVLFVVLGILSTTLSVATRSGEPNTALSAIAGLVEFVVILAWSGLAQAAFVHRALASLNDQPRGLGDSLGAGFRNALPVLAISLLVGLASFVGLLFLVVPGVFLGVAWSAALPAQVAEGRGVFASMSRSWELTRGNRWAVFALHLVASLALMVGFYAIILGGAGVMFAVVGGSAGFDHLSALQIGVLVIVGLPLYLLVYSLLFAGFTAIPSSIYAELVRIRGGSSRVADVFA